MAMTTRTPVNPWTWQDARGFTQAWRVDGAGTTVYVSGQGPLDADGALVGGDDFELQVRQSFDNLGVVLGHSGAQLSDIVKLGVFLTDITRLPVYGRIKAGYIQGRQPASTAVQVSALALPGMLIELEAVAVL
jgi:enamine deaminase RidA (YjgF/YER057c/UK114 family)